jgi:hypothetical protein
MISAAHSDKKKKKMSGHDVKNAYFYFTQLSHSINKIKQNHYNTDFTNVMDRLLENFIHIFLLNR